MQPPTSRVALIALVIALSVLSGMGDAQGFVHAARVWEGGRFHPATLVRSAFGFAFGISLYYGIVGLLQKLGVRTPEVQTLLWFSVTLVGVAVMSGAFWSWRRVDQLVAVAVLVGVAWLMVRTGNG